jgi:hypothetical protein
MEEAETFITTLHINGDKAIKEREEKWKKENSEREFYSRTDEDNKKL